MITTSLFYVLMLIVLIMTCYKEVCKKYHIVAKTLTSTVFIAIALVSVWCSKDTTYFLMLLPGLLFCLGGDVFLAIRARTQKFKWFVWGIVMFALAHLSFVVALQKYSFLKWWSFIIPVFVMIIVYFVFKLPVLEPGRAKWLCIIYSYLVTLFVVQAVQCMIGWEFSKQGIFLAIGATSFCISDCMLISLYFSKKEIAWLHGGNLSTYYIGVGLIASSIYFG